MSHITYEQSYTLSCMLNQGYNQTKIAAAKGRNKSVISREISRNKDQRSGLYKLGVAHKKCLHHHSKKPKRIHFTESVKADIE